MSTCPIPRNNEQGHGQLPGANHRPCSVLLKSPMMGDMARNNLSWLSLYHVADNAQTLRVDANNLPSFTSQANFKEIYSRLAADAYILREPRQGSIDINGCDLGKNISSRPGARTRQLISDTM
jgi:hypothetical protein